MRPGFHDVTAVQPAEGNELVICAVHNSRRLSKFCVSKAVYNADRVVVDYTYECKEESRCGGLAHGRVSFSKQHNARNAIEPPSDASAQQPLASGLFTQATATDAVAVAEGDAALQQQKTGAGRGPSRYYDLANQRGPGATGAKRICWSCGMGGHEKPNCPNLLCRTCHGTRGYHHICQEPSPSPFLKMFPTLLFSEDMSFVKCVYCSLSGHFDCSTVREVTLPSCCFCGQMGHNAYDCHRRKEQVPDHWVIRATECEYGVTHRGDYAASAVVPLNSASAGRDSFASNSLRNIPKGGDAFSSSDLRYNNTRGGGGYRRDGNGGRYNATNSRFLNADDRSYSECHESRYTTANGAEASRYYTRRGEKRLRWSDDERSNYHHNRQTSNHRQVSDWAMNGSHRGFNNNSDNTGEQRRERSQQPRHNGGHYKSRHRRHHGKHDSGDDYDLF